MKNKWIILSTSAISFLVLIIFLSLLLADRFQVASCGCPTAVSQNFIYIFIGLASIFIASLVYYLSSLKIDSQKEIIKKNMNLLYSLLDEDERTVLEKVIKNNGEIYQKEIKIFKKLKLHRVIKKLKEKNIIEVIKEKNINYIKLKKELKKELI